MQCNDTEKGFKLSSYFVTFECVCGVVFALSYVAVQRMRYQFRQRVQQRYERLNRYEMGIGSHTPDNAFASNAGNV